MKRIMTKAFIFSLMLTISLGTFTACSSDDDNKDPGSGSGLAAKVIGTYVGDLTKIEPAFEGEVNVVVTSAGSDEVTVTFSAGGVAPFKAKLITRLEGIIQSEGVDNCQFNTTSDVLIINNVAASTMYTFTGEKK